MDLSRESAASKNGRFDFVDKSNVSLLTDLYELTMCASYWDNKRTEQATFDLFIRKLPPNRSYYVFAGLEHVLHYLQNIEFDAEQLDYLRKLGFKEDFINYLKAFRFTGEVWAVPEGTLVFPNEPLVRVTAPIIEAQLIESFVVNAVNLQTMLATKASRVVETAKGKSIIEFGLRRTHGVDAGLKAARSSYIGGCDGTSNVLAGMKYGIPVSGTMAHSFVMFYENELEAFKAFAKTFPGRSTLLIDTYDDLKGAENAAIVAKQLEKDKFRLSAVRIDSGDLAKISKQVRKLLDAKGLGYVKIFASGDLDEYKITTLLKKNAKIDAFGVGTHMSTSEDRPYVDIIYKLCEKMGPDCTFVPTMKLSQDKVTLPGRKQVFRVTDAKGNFVRDWIGLQEEKGCPGEPMLIKVMEKGEIVYDLPKLEDIRKRTLESLRRFPKRYHRLRAAPQYPVVLSKGLKKLMQQLMIKLQKA